MYEISPYKVLLYFDGSPHSLSAAAYTADLINRIPTIKLTILHVRDNVKAVRREDCNLIELRTVSPTNKGKSYLLNREGTNQLGNYSKIRTKIEEIFWRKGLDVSRDVIYANPNIPDTVDAIIDYSSKKNFELIIMGTKGPSSFKGLIHGSLAHSILSKSEIPVLLIKKLPQEFISKFFIESSETLKKRGVRKNHRYLSRTI